MLAEPDNFLLKIINLCTQMTASGIPEDVECRSASSCQHNSGRKILNTIINNSSNNNGNTNNNNNNNNNNMFNEIIFLTNVFTPKILNK